MNFEISMIQQLAASVAWSGLFAHRSPAERAVLYAVLLRLHVPTLASRAFLCEQVADEVLADDARLDLATTKRALSELIAAKVLLPTVVPAGSALPDGTAVSIETSYFMLPQPEDASSMDDGDTLLARNLALAFQVRTPLSPVERALLGAMITHKPPIAAQRLAATVHLQLPLPKLTELVGRIVHRFSEIASEVDGQAAPIKVDTVPARLAREVMAHFAGAALDPAWLAPPAPEGWTQAHQEIGVNVYARGDVFVMVQELDQVRRALLFFPRRLTPAALVEAGRAFLGADGRSVRGHVGFFDVEKYVGLRGFCLEFSEHPSFLGEFVLEEGACVVWYQQLLNGLRAPANVAPTRLESN